MNILKHFQREGSNKHKDWTKTDVLELLSIDAKKKSTLEADAFISTNIDESELLQPAKFQKIHISCLTGINRNDQVSNWMELLLSLHKHRNFDMIEEEKNFSDYVNSLDKNSLDLPHVIEVDGKYYIGSNGKHRLTIAKCLGLVSFPVLVSQLKK